ncbi:type IV pilus assembly protein PilM [Paraliomyxa miuraensis]|uniref:type IV pilus assembly protein PilM n=1 Tax=Paraliomyxa miuraensis TaxID=376150 RepID=UPI0022517A3A|nr:type IV pilus assembly protein PilM [Paraliomyxa miuraensis]MCX4240277.1 pilus assembly protein PilM [Paraliomyxa miuraensis]
MAKQCIGLDIGSSAIKLVQLKIGRRGVALMNFGIEPIPPQAIVDGVIMNHSAVVDAIRNLTRRIHLRGKGTAIAVSGNAVIIKRLSIPAMEGPALEEQMEWEVRQNIPFSREDVVVDHEVLVQQTPQGQMEVLLVAAKREVVQQYNQAVRDAGLQPLVVDTAAFALQNAVEGGIGYAPGEAVAIINVGASYSTLSIVNNGMPSFNREISAGGNTYTSAIQQRLAVSIDGAEAYKVGGAIAAAGAGADVVPQEVHRILAQVSEQVAEQFQRSLDFYINDAVDTQLSRIYLAGGSSLVPQLPKAIQDRSRIPVEILDPFVRVEVDARRFDVDYLRANAPVASIAFGLSLRRPGDST